MFYLVAAASIVLLLVVASISGQRAAIVLAWALILLLPTWMHRTFGAADVNLRCVIILFTFGILIARDSGPLWSRILFADVVILALVIAIVSSRLLLFGPSPSWGLRVAIDWLLPYMFGRLLFADMGIVRSMTMVVVVSLCVLLSHAIIEAVLGLNVLQSMSGQFKWHTISYRFGLKRAEGGLTHPIYFGFALVLLMPWSIYAWSLARRRMAPKWWRYSPLMNLGCIILSGSRGAIIASAIALSTAFFVRRKNRLSHLFIIIGLCAVTVIYWGQILDGLRRWGGESRDERVVVINGREFAYSGTLHRIVQMRVYERALWECGLLGFSDVGTPDSKCLAHVDYHLRDLFFSIDNHYLQFTLDCGYLGIGLFVLLGVVVISYMVEAATESTRPESLLAASFAGTTLATMIMLWTVWLPPELGFYFLFNCGMVATWRANVLSQRHNSMSRTASFPSRIPLATRTLVPGHPVSVMDRKT